VTETIQNELEDLPIKVLFVDDEEYILKSLRRLLADEDLEILTATSGTQGLEILKETPDIALIVTDQRMPGMTGVDFLMNARQIAPESLRIVLTGYADITATIDAINKRGAHRYISKPWNDEELILGIREAIQRYSLKRENRQLHEIIRKKNEELSEWNANLKARVLEQTSAIRHKLEELHQLNEKLSNNFQNTILALSGLIELRDRNTRSHCKNVADVAVKVAEQIKLPHDETTAIRIAALLHDIGKIGISDALLQEETASLHDYQLREYQLHAVRGQAILDHIEDLRPSGILIRHHHENFDGSGFPDRLSGKEIPLGARIIALVDALDRDILENETPNSIEEAIHRTREHVGSWFDPELYPLVEKSASQFYGDLLATNNSSVLELAPRELRKGMMVAKEVRSGTGLLLLAKGERLEDATITALRRYYIIDPPATGIFVTVER